MIPSATSVVDAVVALLNVAPSCNAMSPGAVKVTQPVNDFCKVTAAPIAVGSRRNSGTVNHVGGSWRVDVRACGTYEENANELLSRARERLDVKPVTVGSSTGHLVFESGDAAAEDADDLGWWTALMTFTVTL